MKKLSILILAAAFLGTCGIANAQKGTALTGQDQKSNYISTGMPVLLISPDAISSALGDAGVASTPDAYSAHWNNAKFAFAENDMSISTTYTPWLRNLGVGDMNLLYLGGYKHINDRGTVGASLTYFSLGEIDSKDEVGNSRGTMNPNEFAFDLTYAMKLTDELSLGATGRFIRSDLTNGQDVTDGSGYISTKPAWSLAADLGLYYEHNIDAAQSFAVGAFFSNLGAKLSYSDDDTRKEFLPSNLRIGGRYSNKLDEYNKINILFDVNKLLVPTPPIGDSTLDNYANLTDYYNTGVILGAFKSFGDAPYGFKEEMQEIQLSAGAEYWYNNTFAARAGYFYENSHKGGRQYLTFGAGVKYNIIQFDFAYMVPTTTISANPLTNTIRISLTLNFAKKQPKSIDL